MGAGEEADADAETEPRLTRRRALAILGGGSGTLGAAKAADNVLLGYGAFSGTNLLRQRLGPIVGERLAPADRRVLRVDDGWVVLDGDRIVVEGVGSVSLTGAYPEAQALDEAAGLESEPVAELVADLRALRDRSRDVRVVASRTDRFFERVRAGAARSFTVGTLRGAGLLGTDPGVVEAFADAPPADPPALVAGLEAGFREHASYDVPRYVAGSIQDNLLFGAVDLRAGFRSPTGFEALLAGETDGLFCYEFARRAVEALHAVPAHRQSLPVVAGVVVDRRHKHVYNVLASVVREDGAPVIPVTFVDYTHATLYDDFALRGVRGDGLEAYGPRHRATDVYWP